MVVLRSCRVHFVNVWEDDLHNSHGREGDVAMMFHYIQLRQLFITVVGAGPAAGPVVAQFERRRRHQCHLRPGRRPRRPAQSEQTLQYGCAEWVGRDRTPKTH